MLDSRFVTAEICTKGRYNTTLPLTIFSVISQTRAPNELIILDDTENPVDLRSIPLYKYLFELLHEKKISWKVIYGKKMGQHFNHQTAQEMAEDLVWRLDDDVIAEPDCLKQLLRLFKDNVGAVGGPVLMPGAVEKEVDTSIDNVFDNQQWYKFKKVKEAQHLYSCFLFKSGIVDYELSLSPTASREETIFSHNIYRKGCKLLLNPLAVCWHLRNPGGGIRTFPEENKLKDEKIFEEIKLEWKGELVAFLNNGIGDHIVFKKLLPKLKSKYKRVRIACCYPDLFEGEEVMSIAEGLKFVNPQRYDVYKFMIDHNWKNEMFYAMERMYDNNCAL